MPKNIQEEQESLSNVSEIDFRDVFGAIRRRLKTIFFIASAFVILGIVYLNVVDHKYTISMGVISTASQGSSVSGSLSSLAAMAGVRLPGKEISIDFDLYTESLTSIEVAKEFIKDNDFIYSIFPKAWDRERRTWINSDGIVKAIRDVVKPILGRHDNSEVSPEIPLEELLDEMIAIDAQKGTPIVTISLLHSDPQKGIKFLTRIHQLADQIIRDRELFRTNEYINYLKIQLAAVNITEYRQVLADLLAEQEQRRMLANTTLSYSAEIFSNPIASPRPTNPRPVLVVLLSGFLGLFFGIIIAMIKDQLSEN